MFDAILDNSDACDLLLTVSRRGDPDDIREVWFTAPRLAGDPFAAPLAVALVHALSGGTDAEIDEAAAAAAAVAHARERKQVITLLEALRITRDDRAVALSRIAAAFQPAPP